MTGPSTGRDATAGTTAKKKRKPRETVVPPQMSTRSKSKQKTQINQSPGASLVDWYKMRNSHQPDAEKFVSKLKSKYFTIEGNDSYLNWQVFGGFAGACFNAPPSNVCFLNGLLDQGPNKIGPAANGLLDDEQKKISPVEKGAPAATIMREDGAPLDYWKPSSPTRRRRDIDNGEPNKIGPAANGLLDEEQKKISPVEKGAPAATIMREDGAPLDYWKPSSPTRRRRDIDNGEPNKIGPAANGLLDEEQKKISPVEKGAPAATIMREDGAPLDYWKPSSPTRRRRDIDNGEQSWAQQLRMKRELQPFMAGKESEEVGENFNEFLTGLDKMLQPKAHEESKKQFKARTEKAQTSYQKKLKEHYGDVDHNASELLKKYNIEEPNAHKSKPGEIWKIRYEPRNAEKSLPTFTIFLGSQKKNKSSICNVTVGYVKYYLGSGFVDRCIAYGERCSERGLNQPAFFVPLGDSNTDVAPDHCLVQFKDNGDRLKTLPYVQGANDCCLGFSFANALHHLNFQTEGYGLYQQSHNLSGFDAITQLKWLSHWVRRSVRGVNPSSVQKCKDNCDGMVGVANCIKFLQQQELVVFVPKAKDGTNTHAVTFFNGLIFDSSQKYAMKLSPDALDFIAGTCGFAGIWRSRLFTFTNELKKGQLKIDG